MKWALAQAPRTMHWQHIGMILPWMNADTCAMRFGFQGDKRTKLISLARLLPPAVATNAPVSANVARAADAASLPA